MLKWISMLLLAVAILAAAGSAVYVMNAREAVSRHNRETAEAAENAAKLAARKAESEQKTAVSNENAEKAKQQAAIEQRKANEAERDARAAEAEKAKHDAEAAHENRAAREAEAQAAAAARDVEKAKADVAQAEAAKAKALADAEIAKAQAEADTLLRDKLAAQAVAEETHLWELRALALATLEKELNDYKRELDEREIALRPEKTIKDLTNIGTEEEAADPELPLLPENDASLPRADRKLAKSERIISSDTAAMLAKSREMTVTRLERLYVEAIRADRLTDAAFYRKTLKSLYPDWKYEAKREEAEAAEEP